MTRLRVQREIDPALIERYVAEGLWRTGSLRDGPERWTRADPARRAVVDRDLEWSYAELEDQIAHAVGGLLEQGVGAGTQVLVVTPICADGIAVFLAVLRIGAVAVMLDRRCGRADVDHAVEPLDIALVVSTPELASTLGLSHLGRAFVTFDALLAGDARRDWDEPDPQAPAAVFFTSGTTSRPKAVVHSIDTMRAGARNMADSLQLTADDAAFLSSPVASITGIMQVFLTLERGAALVLEDRFNPRESLERLIRQRATFVGGAPIIPEELLREARRQDIAALPLRALCLGGAMIPRDLLELAIERWGIVPIRVYGSSEAPMSTYTLPSDPGERRLSDDGALPPGTDVRVVAELGDEVVLRGPMMFLGYLHDDDNAQAFVDGDWLRTGDVGRLDEGRLTITGRIKEVVARKGLKISLPEIDAVVRGLPGLIEASAYGVPDAETGEHLALALRTIDESDADYDQVVAWLSAAGLARWKLPEEIAWWTEPLPRTSSGKVQRRLLDKGGTTRTFAQRLRLDPPAEGGAAIGGVPPA
jgi:acyl-CoA synthetase (AMP-forming)/AMP-acid ligase II